VEGALWVAAGGALGAASRYGVNIAGARILGTDFPWATLIVNIVGCFAMGLILSASSRRPEISENARLFLATGILGGFTTFSAFAADFARMVEGKEMGMSVVYVAASVGVSLVAVFIGLAAGRATL
jgi:fluoride exporter